MEKRNLKTIRRDNSIHLEYEALMKQGGAFAKAVSRKFIYDAISQRTGYSVRTVANVLNHTTYTKITSFME